LSYTRLSMAPSRASARALSVARNKMPAQALIACKPRAQALASRLPQV